MSANESLTFVPRKRLLYLDSMRGLAAIWVVFYHMIYLAKPNLQTPPGLEILRVGGMGVTLFFMISAFSLCMTMPRHIESGRWLFSFYLHRICRIIPLFYAVIAITILVFHYRGGTIGIYNIILSGLCLFNIMPGAQESIVMGGWTIGVEIIFYIIFPLLYKYVNSLNKSIVLLIAAIGVSIISKAIIAEEYYYHWSILRHAPIFVGGIVLFKTVELLVIVKPSFKYLLGVVLCICVIAAYTFLVRYGSVPGFGYYLQMLPFGLLLAGLSLAPLPVVVSPATAFLGQIAFSIYLLQPLVIINVSDIYPKIYALGLGLLPSFALCSLMTISIVIFLAYITFVYIEKPGIRIGIWIMKRYARKPL